MGMATDVEVPRPPYGGSWVWDPAAEALWRVGPDGRRIEVYDPRRKTVTPVEAIKPLKWHDDDEQAPSSSEREASDQPVSPDEESQ